jgi:hypothetical protein
MRSGARCVASWINSLEGGRSIAQRTVGPNGVVQLGNTKPIVPRRERFAIAGIRGMASWCLSTGGRPGTGAPCVAAVLKTNSIEAQKRFRHGCLIAPRVA